MRMAARGRKAPHVQQSYYAGRAQHLDKLLGAARAVPDGVERQGVITILMHPSRFFLNIS